MPGSHMWLLTAEASDSSDVPSGRQGDAAGEPPGLQSRELVEDGAFRLRPASAQGLVEAEQRLKSGETHLREQVLVVEQGGLGLQNRRHIDGSGGELGPRDLGRAPRRVDRLLLER